MSLNSSLAHDILSKDKRWEHFFAPVFLTSHNIEYVSLVSTHILYFLNIAFSSFHFVFSSILNYIFYVMRPFTLLELLIVIMIIAILASIMFPALKLASDTAKRISCTANVKTQVTGVHLYADSYNGFAMRTQSASAGVDGGGGLTSIRWIHQIRNLISDKKPNTLSPKEMKKSYLNCPGFVFNWEPATYAGFAPPLERERLNSILPYGYNQNIDVGTSIGIRLANMIHPSERMIIGDREEPPGSPTIDESTRQFGGNHHNGIGNAGFIDGHAKSVSAASMKMPGHVDGKVNVNGKVLWPSIRVMDGFYTLRRQDSAKAKYWNLILFYGPYYYDANNGHGGGYLTSDDYRR